MNMGQIFQGREVESGEAVFVAGDSTFHDQFRDEVRASAIAQKFEEKYGSVFAEPNLSIIGGVIGEFYPEVQHISSGIYIDAVGTVMRRPAKFGLVPIDTGEETSIPVSPQEPAPVHRGQEMWKQHAEFMRTGGKNGGPPSMEEVRQRKRTNASFRAYVEQAYQAEANPLNDPMARADAEALWAANPHLRPQSESQSRVKITPELVAWAEEYRKTPSERVKQLRSAGMNPLGYVQYEKDFQAAIAAGLIR
jgi:hypothetical protein